MVYHIAYNEQVDAIPNLLRYYTHEKRVGMIICLTGGIGEKIGAGKTYTAMRIGEITDKHFGIDDVCFDPAEFLLRLDHIEATGKLGRVIILDEAEIAIASAEWQKRTNKTIAQTMQTFRYLRCIAIIVTPTFDLIDSRLRKLVTYWGTTELDLRSNGIFCKLRLYRLLTDITGKKQYPKRLIFYDRKNHRLVRAKAFEPGLISPGLVEAYEAKAREFKQAHRRKLLKETLKAARIDGIGLDTVDKSLLPVVAEELLGNESVKRVLERQGKFDTADVLLLKRNLPPTYAALVSQMVNKLHERRQTKTFVAPKTEVIENAV